MQGQGNPELFYGRSMIRGRWASDKVVHLNEFSYVLYSLYLATRRARPHQSDDHDQPGFVPLLPVAVMLEQLYGYNVERLAPALERVLWWAERRKLPYMLAFGAPASKQDSAYWDRHLRLLVRDRPAFVFKMSIRQEVSSVSEKSVYPARLQRVGPG